MSTLPASPGSLTPGTRLDKKMIRGRVRYEVTGAAGLGSVWFTRSGGPLLDQTEHEILVKETVGPVELTQPTQQNPELGGEFAVELTCGDDPHLLGGPFVWTIHYDVALADIDDFTFFVSVNDPPVRWIDTIMPAVEGPAITTYVENDDPRLLPELPPGGSPGQFLGIDAGSNKVWTVPADGGPGGGGTAATTSFAPDATAGVAISATNTQAAVVEVAAERPVHAQTVRVVVTGGVQSTPRPSGVGSVVWIHAGTVRPDNFDATRDWWPGQTPPLGSLTVAHFAAGTLIPESMLSMASDGPANVATRRSLLGSGTALTAARSDHTHTGGSTPSLNTFYVHDAGGDVNSIRPTGYLAVYWVNVPSEPTNLGNFDGWLNPNALGDIEDLIVEIMQTTQPFAGTAGRGSMVAWDISAGRWSSTLASADTSNEAVMVLNALVGARWERKDTRRMVTVKSVGTTPDTWTSMPSAKTEYLGAFYHRVRMDLRAATQMRISGRVVAAGFAGSTLRVEYSLDQGFTWAYITQPPNTGGGTTPSMALGTVGDIVGQFAPIHASAQVVEALVRVVGVGGNAVVSPQLGNIYLETM